MIKKLDFIGGILKANAEGDNWSWLEQQLETLSANPETRKLYMTYTLIGRKFSGSSVNWEAVKPSDSEAFLPAYLLMHKPGMRELARIYLLVGVLESNEAFYSDKVAKIIELADTSELVAFLRFLPVLPGCEAFSFAAVEALRTNIATVFDAIALDNPYPACHFNDQQWNQMYLKAAFMQRDLGRIMDISNRANASLARIISDYAHERWAASRDVDPMFWQPVGQFLNEDLLGDMERLLHSENPAEQRAGFLSCLTSDNPQAKKLIAGHSLATTYEKEPFTWTTLNS